MTRSAPPADGRWAVVGAQIVDPSREVVGPGGILMDGGEIVAVGHDVTSDSLGSTPRTDLGGRFVMPGLIDAHVHLCFDGGPRPIARFIEEGSDDGLPERMAVAAGRALRAGVTTVRDLGGPNSAVFELRQAILEGRVAGPRLLASGCVITRPGGHCHFVARLADDDDELPLAVSAQLEAGADCIKVMASGGVHTPESSSADTYFGLAALTRAAEATHAAGRQITAHATNPIAIRFASQARFDSIQHGSAITEELAGMMADRDVALVPTLGTHAALADHAGDPRIPEYVMAKGQDGHERKFRAFRSAVAAGVRIVGGTDGGVTFVSHDALHRELELMREHGLPAFATLAAGTSEAAREVGLTDRIGRLAGGFAADLLVLDHDPIADIRALRKPGAVLQGGRIVAGALPVASP